MKLTKYFNTFNGALEANRYHRVLLIIFAISNVVLGLALSTKDRTVVMVPPVLEQEAWVTRQDGSMSLRESWAVYVATLLGNVTPRSVAQVGPMLGKVIYPGAYEGVMKSLSALEKEVKTEQLEIQFSPTGVFSIPSKNQVAVSGEFRMRSARGSEKKFIRTYLIGVRIVNYRPAVYAIDIQEGPYKPGQPQSKDGK